VATKQDRLQAREIIEKLESRFHAGPPLEEAELLSASAFLHQSEFPPASDYHARLHRLREQLATRSKSPRDCHGKRNYGGQADGIWMQVQSAYDHLILSTCYSGEFNLKRGRIKISHRFNHAGRIDFVELKFINALHSCLNGELRKLVLIKDYQAIKKDWRSTEAFVLGVLPKELIFLYDSVFRCPQHEVYSWLINFGHGILDSLAATLRSRAVSDGHRSSHPAQLPLQYIATDPVAANIISQAVTLKSSVQILESNRILVRYPTPIT
jgi:hypothetical protein